MDVISTFLESSTIHGLTHISTNKKYVRIFWQVVVIVGFTGAGTIIYQSFQDWNDNPVKTTIETLPIKDITFPKVTVCPPEDTYTDLNYELMKLENVTLSNNTRSYAVELLQNLLFENRMKNMSAFDENNRYFNWYLGYSEIKLPGYVNYPGYRVNTGAPYGSIVTQYFGDTFDAEKTEVDYYCEFHIYAPKSFKPGRISCVKNLHSSVL